MHYSEDQWRRASPLFTWIRDPEADPAGRSFGERGGEYRDLDVVVIVDLGGLLVGVVALNAAGVLDETAFEGDRPAAQRGDSGHLNMQRPLAESGSAYFSRPPLKSTEYGSKISLFSPTNWSPMKYLTMLWNAALLLSDSTRALLN